MAVDLGQIHMGMRVYASDGADLGKVAEVWLGTDPTAAHARCDEEVCSRVQVHRGLLRKQVLYVPYSAIASVSGKDVTLNVDAEAAGAKGWSRKPAWLPRDIEVLPGRAPGGGGVDGGGMV